MSDSADLKFLERMAEAVGVSAALRICAYWGKRKLYVPPSVASDHLIAKVIGLEAAQRLAVTFAGQVLSVPACDLAPLRRAASVALLWRYGVPPSVSANVLGVSLQRIKQLRGQLSLEGYDPDALLPVTYATAIGLPGDGGEVEGGEHVA
jgi:hypothetical protein